MNEGFLFVLISAETLQKLLATAPSADDDLGQAEAGVRITKV